MSDDTEEEHKEGLSGRCLLIERCPEAVRGCNQLVDREDRVYLLGEICRRDYKNCQRISGDD